MSHFNYTLTQVKHNEECQLVQLKSAYISSYFTCNKGYIIEFNTYNKDKCEFYSKNRVYTNHLGENPSMLQKYNVLL